MRILLILLVIQLSPAAFAQGSLRTTLDSAFVVTGEVTTLTLEIQSPNRPGDPPVGTTNPDVIVRFLGEEPRLTRNRQRVWAYTYSVQSFKEGSHTIPSFATTHNGREYRSPTVTVHVAPISALTYKTLNTGQSEIKYYSAIFTPPKQHYERESFDTEVKIYLPKSAGEADGVVAELDHDGIVAWRFEAAPDTTRVALPTGDFIACTFRSTASSIRSGNIQLGPGRARVVLTIRRLTATFTDVQKEAVYFDIPALKLTTLPLPGGAPANFNGAVGTFTVTATPTADLDELEEGDPIAVRLSVTGRGNLDSLPAPVLTGPPSEWKSYEPSRLERQDERRSATGTVSFSQIIRPLVRKDEIPAFELAYFDPRSARYETTRSSAIPFKARPSTKTGPVGLPTPTLATPVPDMQGILGLVDPFRASTPRSAPGWTRYWHVLPALLGIALLVQIIRRHILPRWQPSERERQVSKSLQLVERADADRREFLRATGHFIERWIPPNNRDEELIDLLEQRDIDCYRPDLADKTVPTNERRTVLRRLKAGALAAGRAVTVMLVILATTSGSARADDAGRLAANQAEQAWTNGNYRVALDFYANLSPNQPPGADILYNMGNCHYRLSEPGKAVLFYHRALLADPEHPEAHQNLSYLERTLGSIVIVRAPHEEIVSHLSRSAYRTVLHASLWTIVITFLGAIALTSRFGCILSWCGFAGGLVVGTVATVALTLYPDDAAFAPASERGIVTSAANIEALTEASSAGKKVIEAPPGSLCRILAPRGTWTYVEFADHTRGWLPTDQITPLVPPPAPVEEQRP